MKILVLGVTGMLGSAMFDVLSDADPLDTWGTLRADEGRRYFSRPAQSRLLSGLDVLDHAALARVLGQVAPNVVINCVGLIKQLTNANDPLEALPINAMLPHRLARICGELGARLIHFSTDCVFSGRRGMYRESDISDAEDLYGKSKFIGELHDLPHALTLRTSMIGHELHSSHSLVDWFLSQDGRVSGFTKAIFSGLPTVELARVLRDRILSGPDIHGLYHISAKPISKFALLALIARTYGREIDLVPDEQVVIDRSLDSTRFSSATGYEAPDWPELVRLMHEHRRQKASDAHV